MAIEIAETILRNDWLVCASSLTLSTEWTEWVCPESSFDWNASGAFSSDIEIQKRRRGE
jgi:hypothetical protein